MVCSQRWSRGIAAQCEQRKISEPRKQTKCRLRLGGHVPVVPSVSQTVREKHTDCLFVACKGRRNRENMQTALPPDKKSVAASKSLRRTHSFSWVPIFSLLLRSYYDHCGLAFITSMSYVFCQCFLFNWFYIKCCFVNLFFDLFYSVKHFGQLCVGF